ncbi:hypothetical protein DL769_010263 [Monosporascus sp. CRB-8-3]|nr:hypothetical protein DL769_010263 [Monosporascus sp. CRB-8-3]
MRCTEFLFRTGGSTFGLLDAGRLPERRRRGHPVPETEQRHPTPIRPRANRPHAPPSPGADAQSPPRLVYATYPPRLPREMSYFRITLRRSAIGLPQRTRGVLAALGLRRRTQTVFHPVDAQFAGMIMRVKELVDVEETDRALTTRELRDARRPDPGFWIERAVPR